jgi:SpoVK/Ycf46/Vps4 family AAA+-type ATPase
MFTFIYIINFNIIQTSNNNINNPEKQIPIACDKIILEKQKILYQTIVELFQDVVLLIQNENESTQVIAKSLVENFIKEVQNSSYKIQTLYEQVFNIYKIISTIYENFPFNSLQEKKFITIDENNIQSIEQATIHVKQAKNECKKFELWINSQKARIENNQKCSEVISTIIQSMCNLLQKSIAFAQKNCTISFYKKLTNAIIMNNAETTKLKTLISQKITSQLQLLLSSIQESYTILNNTSSNSVEFESIMENICEKVIFSLAFLRGLQEKKLCEIPSKSIIIKFQKKITAKLAQENGTVYYNYLMEIQKEIESVLKEQKNHNISFVTHSYRKMYSFFYDISKDHPTLTKIFNSDLFSAQNIFLTISSYSCYSYLTDYQITKNNNNQRIDYDINYYGFNHHPTSFLSSIGEASMGIFSQMLGFFQGISNKILVDCQQRGTLTANATRGIIQQYCLKYKIKEELNSRSLEFFDSSTPSNNEFHDYYDFAYKFPRIFKGLISLGVGSMMLYPLSKFNETTGFFSKIRDLINLGHANLISSSDNTDEITDIQGNKKHCEYNLNDKTFDNLRSKGLLDWFDDVLQKIKNPLTSAESMSRVISIEGPSGCGKTTLARAFAQSILEIPGASGNMVSFIQYDPKKLYPKHKDKEEFNIFDAIEAMLESVRNIDGKIIVIYLDEFHLFFTDKTGNIDHSRIADFLKLFADLKQKQKNTPYGIYIVTSTNKPDFLPHEFFDNPDRIATRITINYPTFEERIDLMKTFLKKYGIPFNTINFNYISGIMENENIAQGWIIVMLQLAMSIAKKKHELLNTKHIYESYNTVCRKIINDNGGFSDSYKNYLATYYSAQAAASKILHTYADFDAITLCAINESLTPKDIKDIYKRPERKDLRFGKIFTRKFNRYLSLSSSEMLIEEVLLLLLGQMYTKSMNIPMIEQASIDAKEINTKVRHFIINSYSIHLILKESSQQQEEIINQKYTEIMNCIISFGNSIIKNESFKKLTLKIKEAVIKENFVSASDMERIPEFEILSHELKNALCQEYNELKNKINTIVS